MMSVSKTWKISLAAGTALSLAGVVAPVHAQSEAVASPGLPSSLTDSDFLYNGAPNAAVVELGRNLFFDPILSGNRNISCGTCHDPARGTGDSLFQCAYLI